MKFIAYDKIYRLQAWSYPRLLKNVLDFIFILLLKVLLKILLNVLLKILLKVKLKVLFFQFVTFIFTHTIIFSLVLLR